ncbi:unnamed protein product [Rotaria magnacalcarata]|uniref:Peptidase A2 domain-containing protein n=4 Tax=Rotaria magnacalcarata TaxID=392030 RepID=A0A815HP99_9BILA|nr:unnamed protein product [Rotaria magnacalcarata]
MSTSDTPAQHQPKTSYDSDDSSSSRSVFNRSDFQTIAPQAINTQFNSIFSEGISSVVKAINYEQMRKSNSQIPFLEDKINDQNKTLNNQQSEISNLHKTLGDLYDQMHHLKSVVNSAPHSPVVRPRPNSAIYDLNQYDSHKKIYFYKSTSPTCIRRRHETTSPQIAQATSLYHDNMLPDDNQTRILQEALHKLNAAFERRDAQIDDLKKEINELRQFQSNTGNTTRISATLLMRTLISSPKNLHASALVPIVVTDRSRPAILPTNKFTSTSAMPFTMSLAKILPNFSGKECEMPTKFITEFEILASGLVGNSDEYLLRAVQQSLSETALTWYIQTQLEQPVNSWTQFKQLFIHRGESVEEEDSTPTIISSSTLLKSSKPTINSSQLISSTNNNNNDSNTLVTPMSSFILPSSSKNMKCDITSSYSNQINIDSPPTSYLIAEAKVNSIRGLVLLDTGSGLTIISFQHWSIIGDKSSPLTPYTGPDIHGPEAKNFKHLILIGNDLMKNIGIVLDIQANKMWLRTKPNLQYDISSDLSNARRLDVPLLSTQSRTIPPFYMAFFQVKPPSSILSVTWEASVSDVHRYVIAANSLVRIQNQSCIIQIDNCSSKSQVIYPGQHFATADLYDSENDDDTTHVLPVTSLSTTSTLPCNIIESSGQIYCSTQVERSSNNNHNSITLNSFNFLTE